MPASDGAGARTTWHGTLTFRLAWLVNGIVVLILTVFGVVDAQRERDLHLRIERERLREQAGVLLAARTHFEDVAEFQHFVDMFCREMHTEASPGHHIVLLDRDRNVIARAHERSDADLERSMVETADASAGGFSYAGGKYVAVGLTSSFGERAVVTQSLALVESILRAQWTSRAVSLAVLALALFAVNGLALLFWVRRPLGHLVRGVGAVGRGELSTRVSSSGSDELRTLAGGFNQMAASLERVERARRAELRHAADIQSRLLPRLDGIHGGCEIAALFRPADSVGGDLYDVIELPDGSLLLALLDVSGHGVAAALHTALLRTVLHYEARAGKSVGDILCTMNDELVQVVAGTGEFATCVLVRLDTDSGTGEWADAGHDPPVIVWAHGRVESLEGGGLPLGVVPGAAYDAHPISLDRDARLVLYTDGAHEAANARGELFGRQRLFESLASGSPPTPAETLQSALSEIEQFTGNRVFGDDVTLLCLALRRA
ncbi:Phosphoserine phosphatase RsbU [Phycisphaerae bacterium RAS1]|nr:Phosphoserine phosphatase RsbU [Phycisphaerae bacterium RAS1]